MADLRFDLKALVGQQVARIHFVPAENVSRDADTYLIIECEPGKDEGGDRFMVPVYTGLTSPAPDPVVTLEEHVKEDGAFTAQEALQRAKGKPLGPRPVTPGGALTPEDISSDDARGLTRAEEAIDLAISAVGSAQDSGALEAARVEATELIEALPKERRGPWIEKLGSAYKQAGR